VIDTPVISLDLAATALAGAGVKVEPNSLDGLDLAALLRDPAPASPRTFYWRMGQRRALRHGDWKIVREGGRGQPAAWQLFNLMEDASEKTDLAAREPARLAELIQRYEAWNAAQKPALW
jgi:arylsulfatase A-like enzyme